MEAPNGRRVAVVAGLRTPFLKAGGAFRNLSTLELGAVLVSELVQRAGLDPGEIDQVVFGTVVPSVDVHNVARELVVECGLPRSVDAYSVTRACATSTQALVSAARAIRFGEADVVVCGGSESLSRIPLAYQDEVVDALTRARRAREPLEKVRAFSGLRPRHLLPEIPDLEERSTGLTMGESAEQMAKENGISREEQDRFALRSHRRAVAAWEQGVFAEEVMTVPLPPDYREAVSRDGIPRADTSEEQLARLSPVFDRRYGTVTAGNSSPLTDGAAALVVMSDEAAQALGYTPLSYLRSWAFAAVDPAWQLLMGPALAAPLALERAGMKLEDLELVDLHEAFSAQVLSNLQAFASPEFARHRLGRDQPLGEIPDEKLNVYGGSIALGHPFAATGARQVLTISRELDRRGGGTALITQCAAGGLGAAVVLER